MNPKVLIVEDDQNIRELLMDLLESESYDVYEASNGQIAIDFLRSAKKLPDVILLDLMMPVKDGFAFRADQLNDPVLAGIPVVVMSADSEVNEKCRLLGAKKCLKKPVDVDQVLDALKLFA